MNHLFEHTAEIVLDKVEEAIAAIAAGLPVLVVDDADRENEGDVIMAASHATTEWMAWTIRHTSGVLCTPLPAELADHLGLPPMVTNNEDPRSTAYTVSVDARHGVGTGISAADRATTVRLLADPTSVAGDFVRPGHVFPLRAREGGVRVRAGHTEAAVDLCRMAGLAPVGVIAEVVEDSGEAMKLPGLRRLAHQTRIPLISIADMIEYLNRTELAGEAAATTEPAVAELAIAELATTHAPAQIERITSCQLPTRSGTFTAVGYRDLTTGGELIALISGEPSASGALVRVHSECLTGDALGSLRCDCGPQLASALELISAESGVVVYVRGHEGRGIGLLPKLVAYSLQDEGLDTVAANVAQGLPVDARDYAAAAAVLTDLGLNDIRLLSNNPAKVAGLTDNGVRVAARESIQPGRGKHNAAYLDAKRDLMGHHLDLQTEGATR